MARFAYAMKAFMIGEPRQGNSYVDQDIFCVPEGKNTTLRCNDNGIATCRSWKKCPTWKKDDSCPVKPLFHKWEAELVKRKQRPTVDVAGMVMKHLMRGLFR